MIERDPLPKWSVPYAINKWGGECLPPIEKAWLSHLNYFVHPDAVVAAARLLLPKFVEYEGGVFLEHNFTVERYLEWTTRLAELSEVENMLNHQHVYDLFAVTDDISDDSYQGIANLMAETINIALRVCYPNRQFRVIVSNTDEDYGPTVSFYSISSSSDIGT
ncbi:hypothetical protein [Roseibium sediminis]|uniref:hypothetical protein n=1 Tax=Roseibium sediminis TaxID=1775174 RepID=UPI00123CB728|nr:hypothetical protein [Roseibium sediminis]